ncbi:MAG: DUF2231 domain-containing protein [Nakamurella sp.]
MFDTVFGLPLHPLVIHAVVVFLPLASVSVLVAAVWPKFRRWAGPLPLILALSGTVLTPVATQSGEALQNTGLESSPIVRTHAELGDLMLWWAVGLLVAAGLVYWLHLKTRAADSNRKPSQALVAGIVAIAAITSVGTLVHIYRVGDSGATAVWGSTSFATQG